MKILLASGGSWEVICTGVRPNDSWQEIKSNTLRLLRGRQQDRAYKILSRVHFNLYDGTNGFSDEFQYLHAELELKTYVAICEKQRDRDFRDALNSIKETIEEISELYIRFITVSLEDKLNPVENSELPSFENASQTLKIVIEDFRSSIQSGKYISSIDRLHTAFHEFLRQKASDAGCKLNGRESITQIYSCLKKQVVISDNTQVDKIFKMIATVIDSFNDIRNNYSLAHPNEVLLSEDDALFVVSCVSAIFHYLNAKLC